MSPDGTTIVLGSEDSTLHLWDAKTGAAIRKAMQGHTNSVRCVAVSPDGRTIVSGSEDSTLHLWDAKSGAAIGKAMQGHTDPVTCVAVSPDETTIVSGSDDSTLQLWDAKSGAAIGKTMQGYTNPVTSIAFTNDGVHILSISKASLETFTWHQNSQTKLPALEVQQVIPAKNFPFALDNDGWVQGPGCKHMFWLPTDLRGGLVSQGNLIVIINQIVTVFDISASV
ncbi:hypothetical protein FRB94_004754 [Tulasnella sp. JGI-2019a]|nr:hypothetical protein FRB94_004754 [Tulasnella sp. JGI-2019a]